MHIYKIAPLILALSVNVFAAASKEDKKISSEILSRYSSSAAVKMKAEKIENKKTLGTTTNEELEITYSQNKLHLLKKNPQVEVIYNKKVWIIEQPDLELDPSAKRKVTIISNIKSDFVNQITTLFSSPSQVLKKAKDIKKEKQKITIHVDSFNSNLKSLTIELDTKKKEISAISYVDDIDTETQISVKETSFLKKSPSKVFKFVKQKDDEVLSQ